MADNQPTPDNTQSSTQANAQAGQHDQTQTASNQKVPQSPFEFFAQMSQMNPFLQAMQQMQPSEGANAADLYSQFAQNMANLTQQFTHQSMKLSQQPQHTGMSIMFDLMEGWRQMGNMVSNKPGAMVEEQVTLWKNQLQLWQNTLFKLAGKPTMPVASPEKGDKRFADEEWEANPIFDFLKQNYLLTSQSMMDAIDNVEGMDEKTRQRLAFFTRQWLNAMAPTNFLLTNPEVLKLTLESGGQNLVKGMKQMAEDMSNSADALNVRMTDSSAFKIGENIATSKGKVVFENHMMQLIQYEPATEKVHKRPLLMVPPWINKFYIMDLREKNSFICWAVNEGHTVFVISWANPTPEYRYVGMETYLKEGVLKALDQVQAITGEDSVNITGYCIGGMLVSLTLGYLAATNQSQRIESATLWTAIIDFSDPGDIGVFIDPKIVEAIDRQNSEKGVFDGRMMGMSFSMLRENSLYWNYYVQNYLKGERPVPFDLLYWNSDCTNVTAKLHHFLLKDFYIDNLLRKPNGVEIDGVKIDLSKVKTPIYMVAALQDHIAKWKSCYPGTQVFGSETTFVLGESGHIAGIMNPPNSKYGYYKNDNYTTDPDAWYQAAEFIQDSWWTHWREWIKKYEGNEVPAREVGKDTHGNVIKTFGDAPGRYVQVKAAEALLGFNQAEAYRDLLPKS